MPLNHDKIFSLDELSLKSISNYAKTPDFLISTDSEPYLVIEIGGRGKGRSQFKGTDYSRKIIFSHGLSAETVKTGNKIPLHCLGFAL